MISICRIKIQNLPQICIPTIAILAFTVLMVFAIIPYGLKMGWKSVLVGNRLDAIRSIINQRDFVTVFCTVNLEVAQNIVSAPCCGKKDPKTEI